MRNIPFKGLIVASMAGAALAMTSPGAAASAPSHDAGRALAGSGHANVQLARENRRQHVRRHIRRHIVRHHRFKVGHVRHLNAVQLRHWHGGKWWHGKRHGRLGWWWLAGGIWYWYPERVGAYPTEISAEAVYDYAPEGQSDDSWYYCSDPEGYYPYVKSCNGDWKRVPIQPQAGGDDSVYGMPPGGDDENADDDGGNGDDQGDYSDDEEGDEAPQ
jgi:hypothetical protein